MVGNKNKILVLLIVISTGCAATPFDGNSKQGPPAPVLLNNSANVTQTFEVWVVSGPLNDEVRVQEENGQEYRLSPGNGLSTYRLNTYNRTITSVDVRSDISRFHQEYVLEPGESNLINISDSAYHTILIVLSEDNYVSSVAAVYCGESAVAGFRVTSYPDPPGGLFATYECL